MPKLSVKYRIPALLALVPLLGGALLSRELGSDVPAGAGVGSITAAELRSIVRFLASDEMGGRDTNSPGNRIAALYVAHELEMLGLQPAGDNGTFYQNVALQQSRLGPANRLTLTTSAGRKVQASIGADFFPAVVSPSESASGALEFAGYGYVDSTRGRDDFAGLRGRGRILLILAGSSGERAQSDGAPVDLLIQKIQAAQEKGAAGLIIVDLENDGDLSEQARYLWPAGGSQNRLQLKAPQELCRIPVVQVSSQFLAEMLEDSNGARDLQNMDPESMAAALRAVEWKRFQAEINTDVVREEMSVPNVLALLPGSDPRLQEELVIVGAHLDHVGVHGGATYNGADDNASGTSGVLEIAEALAQGPFAPRRSVLFAFWNAEEKGLLGSNYYVLNPACDLDRTVAMLQLDMIGRNQEIDNPEDRRFGGLPRQSAAENENTLHVIGHTWSSDLRDAIERSNDSIGLDLRFEFDDHRLKLIQRSDHWPFLQNGVPALYLTTGLHPQYHTPEDTAEKINYPKLERVVRLSYQFVWELANSLSRPRLDEQDNL